MKATTRLLLLFMLPVLVIVLPVIVGGGLALHLFQLETRSLEARQHQDLETIAQAAAFGENFGAVHEQIISTLEAASVGEFTTLQLYWEHSRIVDELAQLHSQLLGLTESTLLLEVNQGSAERMQRAMEAYRNSMTVATEIAVVDPDTAIANQEEAQSQFMQFNRLNQRIAGLLASRAVERNHEAFGEMSVFVTVLQWAGILILLALAILAYGSARWLNRHLLVISQGMLDLSESNGPATPALIEIEQLAGSERGPLQQLADAVMRFRDAQVRRQRAEQQIHRLAYYDQLTGLPNWRRMEALITSITADTGTALVTVDLDNFKDINDSAGHGQGDTLLREISRRLSAESNEHCTVARLGGDEFAILLTDLPIADSQHIQQIDQLLARLQASIAEPIQLDGLTYFITGSFGIAVFSGPTPDAQTMFMYADSALNEAKRRGRNTYCYHDITIQETLEANVKLERELRSALQNDEFELYYQLQYNRECQPIGAEALIRWCHPVRGLLTPGAFIDVAEHCGLIVSIGEWVLRKACCQLQKWQQREETSWVTVAVNVSPQQFQQDGFVDIVAAIVTETGVDPRGLKFELTEYTVLGMVEETIAIMHKLRALGISFSMDDFGTGYSSLQYLKRLPMDQVKIDQSFVRDLHTNPEDKAIVKTIIAMGEALELQVVAEGVETQSQFEFLRDQQCHVFQGYFFSRPQKPEPEKGEKMGTDLFS